MYIVRQTDKVAGTIFVSKSPLFTFTIPSQSLIYCLSSNDLFDNAIEIMVRHDCATGNALSSITRKWPLGLLVDFVNGMREVTKDSIPYIANDCANTAVTKVADGIHVLFKYDPDPKVDFWIDGLVSGFVPWNEDMPEGISQLIEAFVAQMEAFKLSIRGHAGHGG